MDETTGDAAVYDALAKILRDVFGREVAVRPTLSAQDVVGWDSFKQVEIILALEERFAIRIRTRELDAVRQLSDLVALVRGKTAG